MIRRLACLLAGLAIAWPVAASASPRLRLDRALEAPFTRAGVRGLIVVYDPARDLVETNDLRAARTRVLPASTFKVMSSLIALEEHAVADETEVLRWDGVKRPIEAWNRDHTMESAIAASAVWFYQEMARRVGADRMRRWLERVGYGNHDTRPVVDGFWLGAGRLRISALEQVAFLDRLRRGDLPFSARTMAIVRRITIVERAGDAVLHAKTGWAIEPEPDLGWYVGWVDVDDGARALIFALRIEMPGGAADLPQRAGLVREILAARGWWATPAPGALPDRR